MKYDSYMYTYIPSFVICLKDVSLTEAGQCIQEWTK